MPASLPSLSSRGRLNLSGKPQRLRYGNASCVAVAVPTQSLRPDVLGLGALGARGRDDRASGRGVRRPDELAERVVAEVDDVVRPVEDAHLDELLAEGDEDEADVRVRALVDVEVVVRGERRHLEVDLVGGAHLLERLAGEPLEDLLRRGVDVRLEGGDLGRVVVVGGVLVADELDDRVHVLAEARIDELVAPDGVPAELLLVRDDPLVDEAAPALGRLQRRDDLGGGRVVEGGPELRVALDLLLHLPEGADLVPVAVAGGVLEPAEEDLVHLAVGLLHDRLEVERRAELREVQHPVDLPVAVVHVDGVLEEDRHVRERQLVLLVEHRLDVVEVALHLRHEPGAPPVGEVVPVDREDRAEVGADLRRRTRRPRGRSPGSRSCTPASRRAGRPRPGSPSCTGSR